MMGSRGRVRDSRRSRRSREGPRWDPPAGGYIQAGPGRRARPRQVSHRAVAHLLRQVARQLRGAGSLLLRKRLRSLRAGLEGPRQVRGHGPVQAHLQRQRGPGRLRHGRMDRPAALVQRQGRHHRRFARRHRPERHGARAPPAPERHVRQRILLEPVPQRREAQRRPRAALRRPHPAPLRHQPGDRRGPRSEAGYRGEHDTVPGLAARPAVEEGGVALLRHSQHGRRSSWTPTPEGTTTTSGSTARSTGRSTTTSTPTFPPTTRPAGTTPGRGP